MINMTVVLLSKHSVELLAMSLLMIALILSSNEIGSVRCLQPEETSENPTVSNLMTDDRFSSTMQYFGDEMDQMSGQMEELIEKTEHAKEDVDLESLKVVDGSERKEIKTAIELVSDKSVAPLKTSLKDMFSSFWRKTKGQLQSASSYFGNKLRSFSDYIAPKVPAKLRRYFVWPTFERFKIMHNKLYGSTKENIYRQMLYLNSQIRVGRQHIRFLTGVDRHLLGATQYSDWSDHEFSDKLNNRLGGYDDSDARNRPPIGYKERLEELKKEGKNIYGVQLDGLTHSNKEGHLTDEDGPDSDDMGPDFYEEPISVGGTTGQDSPMDDESQLIEPNDFEDYQNGVEEEEEEEIDWSQDFVPQPKRKMIFRVVEESTEDQSEILKRLEEEYLAKLNAPESDTSSEIDESFSESPFSEVVDDDFVPIDLRETGCIIPAENQGDCGACYAFAINAAASYYNCMEKYKRTGRKDVHRYNPFFTAECGAYINKPQKGYIDGCNGGYITKAFQFAKKAGVEDYFEYDITKELYNTRQCPYPKLGRKVDISLSPFSREVPSFKNAKMVALDISEIDLHLRTIGPVFVNIRPFKDFKNMRTGVYFGIDESENVDSHSMLLVGHDKDDFNRDYWILWNSFGADWGDNGFLNLYTHSAKRFITYFGGLDMTQ